MSKNKIISFFLKFIPNFFQYFIFKIGFFVIKHKYKKKLIFVDKKETSNKRNLIIIDNRIAIGDFFILIKKLKDINFSNSNFKYYIYCNNKFKNIVDNDENLQKLNFIFSTNDFGSHYESKKRNEDEINIVYDIQRNFDNNNNWHNIYICCNKLDLVHYTILFTNNYNNAYFLSNFISNSKKIHNYNIPFPYIKLWIYFFNYYKKMQIRLWEKKNTYFGDMVLDLLMFHDSYLECNNQKNTNNSKNNIVSFLFCGSNDDKTLNLKLVERILNKLSIDFQIYILGKCNEKIDFSLPLNSINLINKTSNISSYVEIAKKSSYVISVDSSLAHIGYYYEKRTIVLINKSIYNKEKHLSYWFPKNQHKNILFLDEYFFNKKNNRHHDFENEIQNVVNKILKMINN